MSVDKKDPPTLPIGRRTFVAGTSGAALLWACGDDPSGGDAGVRPDSGDVGTDAGVDAGVDGGMGPGPIASGRTDGNVIRSSIPIVGDVDIELFSSTDGQRVLEVAPFLQRPGYVQLTTPFDGPLVTTVEGFRTGVLAEEIREHFGDSVVSEVLQRLV